MLNQRYKYCISCFISRIAAMTQVATSLTALLLTIASSSGAFAANEASDNIRAKPIDPQDTALPQAAAAIIPPTDSLEQTLLSIFQAIDKTDIASAKQHYRTLQERYPNFKPSQLLEPFIQAGQVPTAVTVQDIAASEDEFVSHNLQAELWLRWQYHTQADTTQSARIPANIIQLASHQRFAFLVDQSQARLYLLKNDNGMPVVIADYYAAIGKQGIGKQKRGDHRTPVGVYTLLTHLPDDRLDERYGVGALTLDYPNPWDKRQQRTGSGIWLHGVPRSTYSRPPRSSRGCVTLSNTIFSGLLPFTDTGHTPIVLAESVQWLTPADWQQRQQTSVALLENWRADWQSLDFVRYIQHYSEQFQNRQWDYHNWQQKKQRTNAGKTHIAVTLSEISIYAYPGEQALLQVDYHQHYDSNNFTASANKQQYWLNEADGWKIVYEDTR